jgi:hypothetical protein
MNCGILRLAKAEYINSALSPAAPKQAQSLLVMAVARGSDVSLMPALDALHVLVCRVNINLWTVICTPWSTPICCQNVP